MRDDEELDVQGFWWLPGQTYDDGVPGTLRFSSTQGGTLTLSGHLRRHEDFGVSTRDGDTTTTVFTEDSMEDASTYEFILGQAHNKPFTLHDSFQSSSNRFLGSRDSREVVTVNRIYRGAQFGPPGPMEFDRAFVGMRHLVEWVNPGQITGERSWAKDERSISLLARSRRGVDGFTTDDGFSIDLLRTVAEGGDRLATFALTQDCRWRIGSSETVNERLLLDRAGWLQDLVSIATGRTAQ